MSVAQQTVRPDFQISRISKGNWQISDSHSDARASVETIAADLEAFVDAGLSTLVCGDIYLGVEDRLGFFLKRYRRTHGPEAARRVKVLTTHAPAFGDTEGLRNWSFKETQERVDRSLRRLGQERLDLVQMHWWNYDIPGNVEMALNLQRLQKTGKIDQLGATNYDVFHLREMIDAGVDIVAHTVQYSLLDRRPEHGMVELCRKHDCHLLCYGAVGGGLLSRKWVGIPDPGRPAFENVSLDKYYRIINDFGGWALFQDLLVVLREIALKHRVSIGNVAVRYLLERPQVASVVIGARSTDHLPDNLRVFSFTLDEEDYKSINSVLQRATGPCGDVYELDRNEDRDALQQIKSEYFDVVDGALIKKVRAPVVLPEGR